VIHLRVTSPIDETAELIDALRGNDAVLNLVVLPGSSEHPAGDTLQFDVLNGGANGVFDELRQRGIVERGAIAAETVESWLSDTGAIAERRQSRFQDFTPVWELVDARVRNDGTYPPSSFVLLPIACIIGAVDILTNSQILIAAAMATAVPLPTFAVVIIGKTFAGL